MIILGLCARGRADKLPTTSKCPNQTYGGWEMATDMTILVGTVGQGIMRSGDGGESWRRGGIDQGLHSDALVRTLLANPELSSGVFAGTDKCLYRSEDSGAT